MKIKLYRNIYLGVKYDLKILQIKEFTIAFPGDFSSSKSSEIIILGNVVHLPIEVV